MTNAQKLDLARKFLSVLSAPDEGVVKSVAVDDVLDLSRDQPNFR